METERFHYDVSEGRYIASFDTIYNNTRHLPDICVYLCHHQVGIYHGIPVSLLILLWRRYTLFLPMKLCGLPALRSVFIYGAQGSGHFMLSASASWSKRSRVDRCSLDLTSRGVCPIVRYQIPDTRYTITMCCYVV